MSNEENKALVRQYFAEVVSRGNLTAADELFAADYAIDWSIPDMPRGSEQVTFAWAEWRTAFPDWSATAEQQIAEGTWRRRASPPAGPTEASWCTGHSVAQVAEHGTPSRRRRTIRWPTSGWRASSS
ncbi:MAG: ester cyclase [Chloroflexota bacterium]|nr:ester cyclase [Chloroflexota bacterium]